MASSSMSHDRRCHHTDRSCSSDQHVLAQYRERECRMYRVAERIKNRSDIAIDGRMMVPDIGHRQDKIFSKCAWPIDADAFRMSTKMSSPCQTIATATAN